MSRLSRVVAKTNSDPYDLTIKSAADYKIDTVEYGHMWDLSCGIGVNNVGHKNSYIMAQIENQHQLFLHTQVYGEFNMGPQMRLAKKLADFFSRPFLKNGVGDLGDVKVWFTTSGTEANELAMKLATLYQKAPLGREKFTAIEGGFHGRTLGSLALTSRKTYRQPFEGLFREDLVEFLQEGDYPSMDSCALFMELIRGEDGVRQVPHDWAQKLSDFCKEQRILMILDEVQTGFGRTGKKFALEHYPEVQPDIIVLGKALGGGLPLGAVVARSEIFDVIEKENPFTHLSTFGGNPLSCAAGLGLIEQLEASTEWSSDSRLQSTKAWMDSIVDETECEVRGLGWMWGLDLKDKVDPNLFLQLAWREGVFLGRVLHDNNTIRVYPPVTINDYLSEPVNGIKKALRKVLSL